MVKQKRVGTSSSKASVPLIEIASENESGAPSVVARKRNPPVSVMVMSAIEILNEKKGSSLHAIKKYLVNIYKVDSNRLSPFIKKFIKTSVINKLLIQTSGKGANGSFRLSALTKNPSNAKKYVIQKKTKVTVVADNNIDDNNNDKTVLKSKKVHGNTLVAEPSTSSVIKKRINTKSKKSKDFN